MGEINAGRMGKAELPAIPGKGATISGEPDSSGKRNTLGHLEETLRRAGLQLKTRAVDDDRV